MEFRLKVGLAYYGRLTMNDYANLTTFSNSPSLGKLSNFQISQSVRHDDHMHAQLW